MRVVLSLAIALVATGGVVARPTPPSRAHPAVVRIIVPESGGATLGSGSLVAVNETRGLVVTNWHVVRDSQGRVDVVFPGGFRSTATVLKVDRRWDLAALVIWRPPVAPIPLAQAVPRLGEPLAIAGYGRGEYRIADGRCTNYVSPGGNLPPEMVELSAGARQGDSGGPILNQRGELAGVLFGAAWGTTTGSHCGRVRQFLTPITGDIYGPREEALSRIAQQPASQPRASVSSDEPARVSVAAAPVAASPAPSSPGDSGPVAEPAGGGWTASPRPVGGNSPTWVAEADTSPRPHPGLDQRAEESVAPSSPHVPASGDPGPGPLEQTKAFLVIVGLGALALHALRLLTR